MKARSFCAGIAVVTCLTGLLTVQLTAGAQDWRDRRDENRPDWRYRQDSGYQRHREYYQRSRDRNYDHRRDQQNEWRNIAVGSGLVGALGLVTHDDTLFFAGTAGALYGAYRLDRDRHGDDRARLRAEYFSRPYFYRDGHRYERESVMRRGREYYRFMRRD